MLTMSSFISGLSKYIGIKYVLSEWFTLEKGPDCTIHKVVRYAQKYQCTRSVVLFVTAKGSRGWS